MANHRSGQPMAGTGSSDRIGAAKPRRQIGCREAIAGGGGIHDSVANRIGRDKVRRPRDPHDAGWLASFITVSSVGMRASKLSSSSPE